MDKDTKISLQRRNVLTGIGSGLLAGALYVPKAFASQENINEGSAASVNVVDISCADELTARFPFFGEHQSGITTPALAEAIFISFNVVSKNKAELEEMFKRLSARIESLMKGGKQKEADVRFPPPDSGILGENIHPDGLSILVSVGASLFDKRFGLSAIKPKHLVEMPSFPNDALDAKWCDGDLLLQISANSRETVIYALRDIIKQLPDHLVPRWKMDGFLPARAVRAHTTPINLFGFKDGTGNPSTEDQSLMNEMVWVGEKNEEPEWMMGGSYQAVRLIRHLLEFWDRTPLGQQQSDFGRVKKSGAPLGKNHEFDDPRYDLDPEGKMVSLDSHMRRAEPRMNGRHNAKLFRRSYSYSLGLTTAGQLDMGLIFVCYQANLQTGFIDTQKRLDGEPLEEYIKPFGGGYFFALPGVGKGEYLAQKLLNT